MREVFATQKQFQSKGTHVYSFDRVHKEKLIIGIVLTSSCCKYEALRESYKNQSGSTLNPSTIQGPKAILSIRLKIACLTNFTNNSIRYILVFCEYIIKVLEIVKLIMVFNLVIFY